MNKSKLVRDKIHEIILSNGEKPIYHICETTEEYKQRLIEKLQEEVEEFSQDFSNMELADVLEVIYAICDFKDIKLDDIEKLRKEKFDKAGGFKKRIVLDGVEKK